jgi:DNA repair protein RecN (Recombination protein N)
MARSPMLLELAIHNLVIVEQARLTPGEGLTVVSGETGAGKSLLLDAIEMVSGGRCQAQMVGPWSDAATVTAVFQLTGERLAAVESSCGVAAPDGVYLLRRRIGPGPRSQAWINDVPVTIGALKATASLLVEVHAQHEALRLAAPELQLRLLDAYGKITAQALAYQQLHGRVLELTHSLAQLDGGERESVKERDYLAFQAAEIDALGPKRGEFSELESRHALLSSASHWRELAEQALHQLTEDEHALAGQLARHAKRLIEAPEPRLQDAARSCTTALEAVRDAAAHCSDALERLNPDPGELARIEQRLNAYHELFRKHGDGDEVLFATWERLSARIQELSTIGERRQAQAQELAVSTAERLRLGTKLAQARTQAFAKLAKDVHGHLRDLGMPKAVLSLSEEAQATPSAAGTVRQEFLIQTNPGSAAGRLGDVASGGEAARLTLALAEAFAEQDPIPVMVFDEVDSGVGGRLGAVIGAKLARLARSRTVLAVTHTPQLAAAAHRQYLVNKQQGQRQTKVTVAELDNDARVKEISEMLGGGKAALEQARSLMEGASR